jgi:quinol monooxygenase YgiN
MLLIIGTFRLPPERLDAARPAMAVMTGASRAEQGCLEYGYAEDLVVPGLIHVKERWTDRASLAAHFATAHLAQWREAWPRLEITDRRLGLYEVGEPEPV